VNISIFYSQEKSPDKNIAPGRPCRKDSLTEFAAACSGQGQHISTAPGYEKGTA
jgi:hypothetical protein